jgi:hypothetical protein
MCGIVERLARSACGLLGLTLAGSALVGCAATGDNLADESGFVTLFDGKTLDGWEVMGEKKDAFQAVDGVLYCSGKGGGWLRYAEKPFANFVLRLDYKVAPKANSGVFLRVADPEDPVYTGFEVQVLDSYGRQQGCHDAGAIYDVVTPMYNMSKQAGEWNSFSIYCDDSVVVVHHNGRKIIDTDFSVLTEPIGKFQTPYAQLARKGWIGVQDHDCEVWYRNIRIKELP